MTIRVFLRKQLVLIICVLMFLAACSTQVEIMYEGDYPELFSTAVYTILGARGYIPIPTMRRNTHDPPRIEILEKDNYGRVLFRYGDGNYFAGVSLVIMQKADGEYAYFYPYYNVVSTSIPNIMDEFKEANSWNKELSDESKFERVRITRQKEDGPISDEQLINVYRDIFPITNSTDRQILSNDVFFIRTDNYGRSIYFFTWGIWVGVNDNVYEETYYTVFFQTDRSFDIETGMLEITDRYNYQTELRLFMEANGWNTSP